MGFQLSWRVVCSQRRDDPSGSLPGLPPRPALCPEPCGQRSPAGSARDPSQPILIPGAPGQLCGLWPLVLTSARSCALQGWAGTDGFLLLPLPLQLPAFFFPSFFAKSLGTRFIH